MKIITRSAKPMSSGSTLKRSVGRGDMYYAHSKIRNYSWSMPCYRRFNSLCWEGRQRHSEDIYYMPNG